MPDATLQPAAGTSVVSLVAGLTNLPRSLYLHENKGVQALSVPARDLYLVENKGLQAIDVDARDLYLHENRGIQALAVLARALYGHETARDGEVFPWLEKIAPVEQYIGGQVSLYGDGLGEIVECAAGATITTSSVSGGNIGENTVDRTIAEWISTSGAAAWIRFTFGAAKIIRAIALEDLGSGDRWGKPRFRFDAGGDVDGTVDVPLPLTTTEIPVGANRGIYTLPTPRTSVYVEVAIASGGSGTNRGLREAWIYEDLDQAAETSSALLGTDTMGIVSWSGRSTGLHPANGGLPTEAAAVVTVPAGATSGLLKVREAT